MALCVHRPTIASRSSVSLFSVKLLNLGKHGYPNFMAGRGGVFAKVHNVWSTGPSQTPPMHGECRPHTRLRSPVKFDSGLLMPRGTQTETRRRLVAGTGL